jgi:hypothetical protein
VTGDRTHNRGYNAEIAQFSRREKAMKNRIVGAAVAALIVALPPLAAPAGAADGEAIGRVKTSQGEAFLVRGSERLPAVIGAAVQQGDSVETGTDGAIGITFRDNSVFSTGPNSQVSLDEYRFDSSNFQGSFQSRLSKGTLSVVSGDIARGSPEAMKIRTPHTILGVRGTRFAISAAED